MYIYIYTYREREREYVRYTCHCPRGARIAGPRKNNEHNMIIRIMSIISNGGNSSSSRAITTNNNTKHHNYDTNETHSHTSSGCRPRGARTAGPYMCV